ncbi:hypothetical protein OQA88_880 [Cercophora sp. LCS_1]
MSRCHLPVTHREQTPAPPIPPEDDILNEKSYDPFSSNNNLNLILETPTPPITTPDPEKAPPPVTRNPFKRMHAAFRRTYCPKEEPLLVLPTGPTDAEKRRYICTNRIPLYIFGVFSFLTLSTGMWLFAVCAPIFAWYGVFVGFLNIYLLISYLVGIIGRDWDYAAHQAIVVQHPLTDVTAPTVDVYLPCCSEPLEILENTYQHVVKLDWPAQKLKVYVLDDGNQPLVKDLATKYGFEYIVREDRPRLRKAGNLRWAFARTSGDFFAIFDADFCPRRDFLKELVVEHVADPRTAIVQSPQFFRVTEDQTWVEQGAGATQELFYRVVQVNRNRWGASICVGSNAVYRREALEEVGGTAEIGFSEDVHTGFDATDRGWKVKYVPLCLATGICPNTPRSFFSQQMRWARGSTTLLTTKRFWVSNLTLMQKICYLCGLLYYSAVSLGIFISPVPGTLLLVFRPEWFKYYNLAFAIPSIVYGSLVFRFWAKAEYGFNVQHVMVVQSYAYLTAIKDRLFGIELLWAASGDKRAHKSNKYRNMRLLCWFWTILATGGMVAAVSYRLVGGFAWYHTIPLGGGVLKGAKGGGSQGTGLVEGVVLQGKVKLGEIRGKLRKLVEPDSGLFSGSEVAPLTFFPGGNEDELKSGEEENYKHSPDYYKRVKDRKTAFDISFPLRRFASNATSGNGRLSRAGTSDNEALAQKGDLKGPLGLNLLHLPSEPEVDLVFVHGLGGGSRKTWSKTSSPMDYWPAEWLSQDPEFSRVRIHSYGYDSDWTKGNDNCLNIQHIGKSFMAELATSPHIDKSNTSIILIGHSMGGLVIKKAYMLAHQDRLYKSLADRIRVIYFLGTPHRGSDSARLLKNVLQIASSAPAYVTELVRGSGSLQAINDEFRQFSDDVELWSFYETQKLSVKGFSALIVDPESATLGYRDERQIPMNADHRSICKFHSPQDQNYIIIRNSLVSSIAGLSRPVQEHPCHIELCQTLKDWLCPDESIGDDLSAVQEARVSGTCEWFVRKPAYCRWGDANHQGPPILWLSGKPATGKSVLSGFVVENMDDLGLRHAYYFFKHGDSSKSKLSTCLRVLAFQMAVQDENIRDKLTNLQNGAAKFDLENERSVWRSLFVSTILPNLKEPYFWVLDALDECSNAVPFLESMISKVETAVPLRIFITARQVPELLKQLSTLGPDRVLHEQILTEETLPDIKTLVNSRAGTLIVVDDDSKAGLIDKVVQKSNGSFLWTRLVLDELSGAFSEEDTNQVLDEVPQEMECLYHRALDVIARATRGKALAKAILEWVACATKPLTVQELCAALEMQLKSRFPNLGRTIIALCGQLVTVDKNNRVQMIHETAREFLMDERLLSDLAVRKTESHTKIATVCLEYLNSDELKPPRAGRRPFGQVPNKRSPFFVYAWGAFSHHLTLSNPSANGLLSLVSTFLKCNILSWIEYTALAKSLALMVQVAKDLRHYAELCVAERSPLSPDFQRIKAWTTDLQRIAAKFSNALVTSPASIYSLIPPFCPIPSAINDISATGRRLTVTGVPNLQWDDRLSCIDFQQEKTSAICYGEEYLAVGLIGGRIALYHPASCQEFRSLHHGETLTRLSFKTGSDLLASCSSKTIKIWDVRSGQSLHVFPAPRKCLKLWFEGSYLLAATNKSEILSWGMENTPPQSLPKRVWRDSPNEDATFLSRPPVAFSLSIAHRMLAVAYSGQPITIWDLEGDAFYGTCGKKLATGETATHPLQALQFNPNETTELIAASYLDGDLVIIDPFNDVEIERQRLSCHTLAASPDGRFLAAGGAGGVIQIFEFGTLKLVYKVRTSDLWIKELAFSHDGMQLVDLRGSRCNVWTPPVLIGGYLDDDMSADTSNTHTDDREIQKQAKVTCMTLAQGGVICGKEDGSIALYDITSGSVTRDLYCHKAPVRVLQWLPQTKTILSVCVANRIQAWELDHLVSKQSQEAKAPKLDARLEHEGYAVSHLTVGEAVGKLLLST